MPTAYGKGQRTMRLLPICLFGGILFSFFLTFANGQEPPSLPIPTPASPSAPATPNEKKEEGSGKEKMVSLDFNNVDLPVLVKFISELTGKNFVIDEQVRGKVTIFSPAKIPASHAYDVFLSVMDLKGFTVVQTGDLHQILPFAASPTPRTVYLYTLEHTEAEEIAKVVLGLVSKSSTPVRMGPRSSGEVKGNVQIVTDKTTNRLIITASEEDYKIVTDIIKQLDVKQRQVYVEAVVMEMSADKVRDLGTDLGAVFGYTSSDLGLVGGLNRNPEDIIGLAQVLKGGKDTSDLTGFGNLGIRPINARIFLHALQSSPEANVLSTPQILTSDKQKAEIVVAQNVPFPGSQSQTTGGNVQTTIERKDVGIILRLTPTVMENKMVKLDIYQEISSVVETASTADVEKLGPTTNKRSASTKVVVRDGQTAVIGGLIKDNVIVIKKAIPILSRIPILGWLFKSESKRVEKTNLLIFVTPHIVPETNSDLVLDTIRENKVKGAVNFMEENRLEGGPTQEEFLLKNMINLPK